MPAKLFRRSHVEETIRSFYGAIVAQARQPVFYTEYGVPDTVEGRFEMIVLHLVLLVRRLRNEAQELRAVGQGVFDAFCVDMDDNLREMGLSDMAVPRRMRRFGEAFYGRAAAYDRALDESGAAALTDALARNVFPASVDARRAHQLAHYVRFAEQALTAHEPAALARGDLRFLYPFEMATGGSNG